MKLLVAGTRTFSDFSLLCSVLDKIARHHDIDMVVVGDARGADSLAFKWAMSRKFTVSKHHADWKENKKAAGLLRNQEMVDMLGPDDAAVFFFNGSSAGTADCIKRIRKKGIKKIKVIRYEDG